MKQITELLDAEKFYNKEDWSYHFPFKLLHEKYGRIEWRLEPIIKRGKIVKILLAAKQTDDPEYMGKTYSLDVYSTTIFGSSVDTNWFLGRVWRTYFCPEHRTMAYEAYPPDGYNELVIEKSSSIGIRAEFVNTEPKSIDNYD